MAWVLKHKASRRGPKYAGERRHNRECMQIDTENYFLYIQVAADFWPLLGLEGLSTRNGDAFKLGF